MTRMFAAFNGTRLVGVARCVRHPDGLELDGVYILEEVRRKGSVRGVTALLIDASGKQDVTVCPGRCRCSRIVPCPGIPTGA